MRVWRAVFEFSCFVRDNCPAGRGVDLPRNKLEYGITTWGALIMNPLETIQGTVIAGVVLAVILAFAAKAIAGA